MSLTHDLFWPAFQNNQLLKSPVSYEGTLLQTVAVTPGAVSNPGGGPQRMFSGVRKLRIYGRQINNGSAIGDMWEAQATVAGPIVRNLLAFGTTFNISVISDSANDTSAGTGARIVRVIFLDANGVENFADYTLNGTTAVTTSTALNGLAFAGTIAAWRIQEAYVLTAGTGQQNAGNISVNDSTNTYTAGVPITASKIYGYIAATFNISHHGFYTVPTGYIGQLLDTYLDNISTTITQVSARFLMGISDQTSGLMQTTPIAGDGNLSIGGTIGLSFDINIFPLQDVRFQSIGTASASSELICISDIALYPIPRIT